MSNNLGLLSDLIHRESRGRAHLQAILVGICCSEQIKEHRVDPDSALVLDREGDQIDYWWGHKDHRVPFLVKPGEGLPDLQRIDEKERVHRCTASLVVVVPSSLEKDALGSNLGASEVLLKNAEEEEGD
ncbi:hypothetical protein MRB53_021614 [Persea americana]|uniref:Uncharacterized protein n=1 Tax=Persea americana TaxID=3435 RepID=A0ACC2L5D7_PERAE|nr:hypothetical protein MRB53_021614 [Persea americana]